MSGHSKWHSIKHKKAVTDAKKGKIFNKIIREITVAVRTSGGDPEANPRLRLAMQKAKSVNMPSDNIDKAIKKGTGELEGVNYEETIYEGYGPGGTAILIEVVTDNKNRTTAEIRSLLGKNGGNLGENGCVAWMFSKKGFIAVKKESISEEDLFNIIVDAGAEDLKSDDELGVYEITVEPEKFEIVKKVLNDKNIFIDNSDITMLPKNYVKIENSTKVKQMVKLIGVLEDNDDVQNVYTNADMPADAFEEE